MKKFLIGLAVGLALAGMFVLIAVLAMAKFGDSRPTVAGDSTLVLRLEGELPEKAPMDLGLPFMDNASPMTVIDVWQGLKKAATDPKIKAVVLMPRGMAVGWAKLQELRGDLLEFKKSGKPLLVFLRAPRTPEYYLASAADKVYMVPEDLLDMKGVRAEVTYYKGALDKIGARMEAEHAGKYKDALDTYTRTGMTPETREVLNSVLDGLYNHLAETVGSARKMTVEQAKAVIDQGPFLAEQAVKLKLVDATLYEDQFFDEVKKAIGGGEVRKVGLMDFLKSAGSEGKSKVAIIVSEGGIIRGGSAGDAFGEDSSITVANSIKVLHQVAADDSIKGVILRVDSPGGDAVASDEILREVKLLSKKKPLIISMSDVAASGGYYISMTGDPVLAYPNTITGSIGVIYGKLNIKGLYDKLGLTKDLIQRGENAAIDSEYYELTPGGRKKLREGVDEVYKTFVGIVAESRKKKFEEIDALAQGRVWLGSQAKDRALVDELGGLDRAVEMVKERAKIGKDEKVRLLVYPQKKTLFEQLLAQKSSNVEARVTQKMIREFTGGLPLEMWQNGAMLKLMPYRITVR
jgi:protease IV